MSKSETLLGMVNSYNDCITCTAEAPSKGRRCRNRLNRTKVAFAYQILNDIDANREDTSRTYAKLLQLAEITTSCQVRSHQDQHTRIADQWFVIIQKDITRCNARARSPTSPASDTPARASLASPVRPRNSVGTSPAPTAIRPSPPSGMITTINHPSTPASTRSTTQPSVHGSRQTNSLQSQQASTASAMRTPERCTTSTNSATLASSSATTTRMPDSAIPTTRDTCSICLDTLSEPHRTPCGHTFCRECLSSWFGGATHKSCPMDRKPLAWDDVVDEWVQENTCGICLEVMGDPCMTPCGHRFCRGCLRTMFNGLRTQRCPMDRKEMAWSELQPVSLPARTTTSS